MPLAVPRRLAVPFALFALGLGTFLLVGLVGVDFDDHQRYTLKWALGSAAVLLLAGLVTLVIPLRG